MMSRLYAIHDRAASAFGNPLGHVNDAMACRALAEFLLSDRNTELFRYHGSYDLYYIGGYDTDIGVISPVHPVLVSTVSALMPQ